MFLGRVVFLGGGLILSASIYAAPLQNLFR
jgi:hypothetical protein